MILELVREYFEMIESCATRVRDGESIFAVSPEGETYLVKILLKEPKSSEIIDIWAGERIEKKVKKFVCCPPPLSIGKEIDLVKERIRETVRRESIEVKFLDEMIQDLIDLCSERKIPWESKFTKLISIIESFYNAEPEPLIRLRRKKRIEYDFRDVDRLYSEAIRLHGKENMENYLTTVYYLDSKEVIKEVIDGGGEYIVLRHDENIIGIAGYKKGLSFVDMNGEEIRRDDFAIVALLVDERERGRGYGRKLFVALLRRPKMKGVKRVLVPITGRFDRKKKGKVREMSIQVEKYCKEMGGELIGFTKQSFGPVYEINLKKVQLQSFF